MYPQKTSLQNDLSCYIYGNGSKNVWCFHGFGQDHRVFKNLAKRYPEKSFHCFDLAFHGSHLSPSSKEDWLLKMNTYWNSINSPKLELIGFSIGARPSLELLNSEIFNIEKVIFIAPDGITNHPFFSFFAGNKLGKKIFRFFLHSPSFQKLYQKTVKHLFFLDKHTRKMGLEIGSNTQHLKKLHDSWLYYFNFSPNQKNLAKYVNTYQIDIQFILGKYDNIITKRSILPLFNLLDQKKIELFQCNHWNLLPFWIRKHNI